MLDSGLASLERIGLLSRVPDPGFARLVGLLRRLVSAPIALITVVLPEENRQVFRASAGLAEPWATRGETPLSHSFCRLVRESGRPLVVTDARSDARVAANPAIEALGVVAYLGAPLHGPDGSPIGAVCVIDRNPRIWTDEERALVDEMAAAVDQQIALLAAVHERDLAIERAWKARLAKSRMLAGMSHEIRTPLFGVLGVVQILEGVVVGPEKRQMCATIRASGETLLAIVDDVLDLSKIEIGGLELAEEPFGPLAVADSADALLRPLAARKGLSFLVEAWRAAGCDRVGDGQRVQQIVNNLLTNAIGSTERGYVRLTLSGDVGEPLRIEVEDSGAGTPLEPGELAPDEMGPRRLGGRGLGMMIVRGLIAQMDGRIFVDARPGEGTCVRVELPFPARPVDPALRALREGGLPPALEGRRAILVCGDGTTRFVLEAMLGRLGMRTEVHPDGRAALQAWEPRGADVLLVDMSLPDLDAADLIGLLRAKAAERDVEPPPVLGLCAPGAARDVEQGPPPGFAAMLAAPVHLVDLIREIERLVHVAPEADAA